MMAMIPLGLALSSPAQTEREIIKINVGRAENRPEILFILTTAWRTQSMKNRNSE